MLVKVLKKPVIPNTFSPNGDGIHDQWVIKYLENYPDASVEIFNRYGQPVIKLSNYKPWDGTYNGKPVPVGTYYYIINPKNGRKQMTGFVDVIR
jgi:gliding motility-associated-like protein